MAEADSKPWLSVLLKSDCNHTLVSPKCLFSIHKKAFVDDEKGSTFSTTDSSCETGRFQSLKRVYPRNEQKHQLLILVPPLWPHECNQFKYTSPLWTGSHCHHTAQSLAVIMVLNLQIYALYTIMDPPFRSKTPQQEEAHWLPLWHVTRVSLSTRDRSPATERR